jgi:hypothetical protein
MTKLARANQISSALAALSNEGARSWINVSLLIIQVDELRYWQDTHSSLSDWIRNVSGPLGYKESSLWRYFTSGRYYQQLQITLDKKSITSPKLQDLSPKVSPENLEILAKLERVMPKNSFIKLAQRVINIQISRDELRLNWQAYRPILEGKTARVLRDSAPKISHANPRQKDNLRQAEILTTISLGNAPWIGVGTPDFFELFIDVRPERLPEEEYPTFDAVAAVRMDPASITEFHGIEIHSSHLGLPPSKYHLLELQHYYCDYLWLAVDSPEQISNTNLIPKFVGLIVVRSGKIDVIRRPIKTDYSGTKALALSKGLLFKKSIR